MPDFECSLKDLNSQPDNKIKADPQVQTNDNIEEPKNILSKNNQNTNIQTMNNIVSDSFFGKITEEKNIRIILLVIISYLITNSDQFTQFLANTFPYLVDAGVTNLLGKTVVAVVIGLSVVIFTSFFQVP
tara:strand:- start:890 stop:1279 length:390 start_codon:yes stop_codon:yes gene_type:complete